jgi:hypothetical protein
VPTPRAFNKPCGHAIEQLARSTAKLLMSGYHCNR